MTFRFAALLCLSATCAWAGSAYAAKSYDSCTGFITQLPATIGASGTWCLKQDLAMANVTGYAITVLADDVTVECNDHAIDGTAAGAATNAFGIFADSRRNLTVRHCKIRGFYQGTWIYGDRSGGHTIEDNFFERNKNMGISVMGGPSVVRRNHVTETGGSTSPTNPVGIQTSGIVNVLDNTVSGVFAGDPGIATGIHVGDAGTIARNRVRDIVSEAGYEYGIVNAGFKLRAVYRNNQIVGRSQPESVGLYCMGGVSNDRVKNNVIFGFPTGIKDCGGGAGNDVTP